jgi:predicted nucleic acid-binding protein
LILADSSIWIDHFRLPNPDLVELVSARLIYCHPGVIGELACGNLADRHTTLRLLNGLHRAPVARHIDVIEFIHLHNLMGRGVGYIDMQLLASTAMLGGALWTRDRRLKEIAEGLHLSYRI